MTLNLDLISGPAWSEVRFIFLATKTNCGEKICKTKQLLNVNVALILRKSRQQPLQLEGPRRECQFSCSYLKTDIFVCLLWIRDSDSISLCVNVLVSALLVSVRSPTCHASAYYVDCSDHPSLDLDLEFL